MDSLFSSNTCNAPINLMTDKAKDCNNFCDYSFNYPISSIKITNDSSYLLLNYDNGSTSPVIYGEQSYTVREIRIYNGSLNSFNGITSPSEILIIHDPVAKGNQLIVSIPVTESDNTSINAGSLMVNAILKYALSVIPKPNDSTTINNIKNFSLNMIIPKKVSFYKYTGANFLAGDCSSSSQSNTDVLCFLPNDAKINITSGLLTSLKNTISPNTILPSTSSDIQIYINDKGATNLSSDGSSDVEMDCRPYDDTADPVEQVDYVEDTDPTPMNPSDIFKSSWFQVIAGSLSFFLIICILNFIFGIFQKNSELSEASAAIASGKGVSFSLFSKK